MSEYTDTVQKVMETYPDLDSIKEEKLLAVGQAVAIDVLKDRRKELDEIIKETEKTLDDLIEGKQ